MWEIAKNPDQPQIPPTLIIALLRRIISHQNDPAKVCGADMDILETIEYLELLEHHRTKRIKALENRGGPLVADFLRTAGVAQNRYNFALVGLKMWVCVPEDYVDGRACIRRLRGNLSTPITHNISSPYFFQKMIVHKRSHRRIPNKSLHRMHRNASNWRLSSPTSQKAFQRCLQTKEGIFSASGRLTYRNYDASKHPALLRNQSGLPWSKVSSVLMSYLDTTKILFQRSEILINSERRIGGRRIENEMIRTVLELSNNCTNWRWQKDYNEKLGFRICGQRSEISGVYLPMSMLLRSFNGIALLNCDLTRESSFYCAEPRLRFFLPNEGLICADKVGVGSSRDTSALA